MSAVVAGPAAALQFNTLTTHGAHPCSTCVVFETHIMTGLITPATQPAPLLYLQLTIRVVEAGLSAVRLSLGLRAR